MNRYLPAPATVSTEWIKLYLTRMDSLPPSAGLDAHPGVAEVDAAGAHRADPADRALTYLGPGERLPTT